MPLHRAGPGPSIQGPIWVKENRDATPHIGPLTAIVFSNSANLTGNATLQIGPGSPGDADTVAGDRVVYAPPFPCSIMGWSAALNKTLATVGSTARVRFFRNGVSLTGSLAPFSFAQTGAGAVKVRRNTVSDMSSFTCTAAATISCDLVMSNHTFGAVNRAAIILYTV
jgi:hypothetical protein